MVQQRIAGKGFKAIADELNERGIPGPRGGQWHATTVSKILTSPALLGYVVEMEGSKGVKGTSGYKRRQIPTVKRDNSGQPIMFTTEPLIDRHTWDLLQDANRAGQQAKRGVPQSQHMLYRVLFCGMCSPKPFSLLTAVPMYGSRRNTTWQEPGISRESVGVRGPDGQISHDVPAGQLAALGAFIQEQRFLAGLSQSQLASLALIGQGHISRIERGMHQPTVTLLKKLSGALNVPVDALLAQGNLEVIPQGPYRPRPHNAYYTCKSCGLHVRIDKAEPLIEAFVMQIAGPRKLLEKSIIRGDDHASEISRLTRAIERRRELLSDDPDDEGMRASLGEMEQKLAKLAGRRREPDRPSWKTAVPHITVARHWAALDTTGRAKFLRDWDVVALAHKKRGVMVDMGSLEVYTDTFKLVENRLVPAALPALISHARAWQKVEGAVLPAIAAQQISKDK